MIDTLGPLILVVPFVMVAVLALVLRWATSRGHSVVAGRARPGPPGEYGLLVAVSAPPSAGEAERLRAHLVAAGIPVTLAETTDGPRLLVFPDDEQRARLLLGR